MMFKSISLKYLATVTYIALIVVINVGFSNMPIYIFWGAAVSLMDPIAGIVYLFRDFAQRELGHFIFIAMLIGCFLSFWLAAPIVALASVTAFFAGELLDWAIFTFAKKPLGQRLLWSALLSAPLDSLIFLMMIHRFNGLSFMLMLLGKVIGIAAIFLIWRYKNHFTTAR